MSDQTTLETPSLRLPLVAGEQAQKHVTVNEALAALDTLVQLSVKSRSLAEAPAAAAEGDRYIVAPNPTGLWAGRAGEIAAWRHGAWSFHAAQEGWLAWLADEEALIVYEDGGWRILASEMQNLALFGLGTAADAANPFVAKLNKALWTAKAASEGGSGDLRFTMSKETAADVLSLLLQSGFSGRAEIGLVGDDDLAIKVSPDGASWIEALRIDKDDGAALLTGVLTMDRSAGALPPPPANTQLHIKGELSQAARLAVDVMGTSTLHAPNILYRWARNSGGSPAAAQANDILGMFSWFGYGASDYSSAARAQLRGVASQAWTDTAQGTRLAFFTTPNGTILVAEAFAVENNGALSMGGAANIVIDANRHHRLRAYTVATLPAASPAGQLIHVSDGSANRRMAVSDGTVWRFPDGAAVS